MTNIIIIIHIFSTNTKYKLKREACYNSHSSGRYFICKFTLYFDSEASLDSVDLVGFVGSVGSVDFVAFVGCSCSFRLVFVVVVH